MQSAILVVGILTLVVGILTLRVAYLGLGVGRKGAAAAQASVRLAKLDTDLHVGVEFPNGHRMYGGLSDEPMPLVIGRPLPFFIANLGGSDADNVEVHLTLDSNRADWITASPEWESDQPSVLSNPGSQAWRRVVPRVESRGLVGLDGLTFSRTLPEPARIDVTWEAFLDGRGANSDGFAFKVKEATRADLLE